MIDVCLQSRRQQTEDRGTRTAVLGPPSGSPQHRHFLLPSTAFLLQYGDILTQMLFNIKKTQCCCLNLTANLIIHCHICSIDDDGHFLFTLHTRSAQRSRTYKTPRIKWQWDSMTVHNSQKKLKFLLNIAFCLFSLALQIKSATKSPIPKTKQITFV